jgi:hypothetical protein
VARVSSAGSKKSSWQEASLALRNLCRSKNIVSAANTPPAAKLQKLIMALIRWLAFKRNNFWRVVSLILKYFEDSI